MSNRVNTVVGKNGCGKSHLLRLVSGIDVPSSGEMYLDKIKLLSSSEYHDG
jgi:ABC-type cobalamin/Fe3+-siderophores transport system ATPase subunit